MTVIKLGTRASPLALEQTTLAQNYLSNSSYTFEVNKFTTLGDRVLDRPLHEIGGKELFSKEIHRALLQKRIDSGIHSLKDLEAILPTGIVIGCVLPRDDPMDVLLTKKPLVSFIDLLATATIGTCAPRRVAQLLEKWPKLKIVSLRGNIQTRLKTFLASEAIDGIILAAAGLKRLGLLKDDHQTLKDYAKIYVKQLLPEEFLPALGQGIIAIDCRLEDHGWRTFLEGKRDPASWNVSRFERAVVQGLHGTCQTVVGGYTQQIEKDFLHTRLCYAKALSSQLVYLNRRISIASAVQEAHEIARELLADS